ncbi:GntR family transcriptional regulator [Pseudonocardia alaniniphila]|uniref:GntR family transcriptional regulator n=1 Tax=Pseudonocardia alaniniphila TaxID=75291 RepID=A0ABS9T9C9_9PSEU|nr:GntR family transcriptional regulator [Pseudonocardia alaniniphila]MCH6165028.1 GntR family transcriptional regulator [Pseudonocardia alaniniphila]
MSTNAAAGAVERSPDRATRRMTSSRVAAMIRDAIAKGELLPGEQVRQQEWAEKAQVSRPPIREALEVLTSEGLLDHSLNRGYFVARISLHEMRQLYLMRRLLENETAATAVWPSDAKMAELSELVDRARAADARADRAEHMALIEQFLLTVHRLSPEQLVVQAVVDLWARTSAYRALSFTAVKISQIDDNILMGVLKALRENDRTALCEQLLRPTVTVYEYIERSIS